jgi:flagellar FliL protein
MSADTVVAAPEAAPAKKGKGKLLVMLLVVLVAAGAAYFFFLKPAGGEAAAAEPVVVEKGEVAPLEPIYINLAQGHFLKLAIALQLSKDATAKETDGSEALDAAIEIFSGQDMDTLSDTEARAEYKAELVDRVTEAYEGDVIDVFLTEFVMQ